jgi:hypothetical protein
MILHRPLYLFLQSLRYVFLFFLLPGSYASTLKLEINVRIPSCIGNCDGLVDLTVTGGQPGYKYSWSNGLNTEDYSHACAGSGKVTVQDAAGNTATIDYVVKDPLPISLDKLIVKQPTPGLTNGSIELTVTGGSLPYTFSRDGLHYSTANQFSNLAPGLYVISIRDVKGCLVQSSTIELDSVAKSKDLNAFYRLSRNDDTHVLHMYSRIPLTIDLMDLPGRVLTQEGLSKSHDIPLDDLDYGVYILKISDGLKTAFEKIVKSE